MPYRKLTKGQSTALLTNFDQWDLHDIAVFNDEDLPKIWTAEEGKEKNPQVKQKKRGRPQKKRLFESPNLPKASTEGNWLSRDSTNQILDLKGNMQLFSETLNRLDLAKEDIRTTFWDGLNMSEPKEVMHSKSSEQLRDVNLLLDNIEHVLTTGTRPPHGSKPSLTNQLFNPTSFTSRIFVDNAGPIMDELFNNSTSIKEVSEMYGVGAKSLRDSMRYYLFRRGPLIETKKRKLKLRLECEQELAEVLEAYLCSRKGRYTNLKMMIDHLKDHFKDTARSGEFGFTSNFINRARVTKILKERLQYTWRKNCHRDSKAENPRLVAMRKVFPKLLEKLANLGYNIVYVDESAISPTKISTWCWQKKAELAPLLRDTYTRINVIAAHVFKGKYALMLKKGPTRSEHVIRFIELLDQRMKELFGEEYRQHTILVLDNAKVHTSSETRGYLRQKGLATLMLPAYSPELNKAEHIFQSLKSKLRKECLYGSQIEHLVARVISNF